MALPENQPVPSAQKPVVRFAPTPNGYLHLGHAYSALFSKAVAEALSARMIIRIEDIDHTRARTHFVEQIFDDLAWLGQSWEDPVRVQSHHMDVYAKAIRKLLQKDILYKCDMSRRQIADAVTLSKTDGKVWPRDPDGAPIFAKKLLQDSLSTVYDPARAGALRLDMSAARTQSSSTHLEFCELGPQMGQTEPIHATPQIWGDPTIVRMDIPTSYHLSVVVDDAIQGVTHVTRGMDLFQSTHLHRLLQHFLEISPPLYAHHPLLHDKAGAKLAKRHTSPSLKSLREDGITKTQIYDATGIASLQPWFDRLSDR
jgi:glutamyl-Q tRNA(Asp) synthetase